jgi:hypothetical protein
MLYFAYGSNMDWKQMKERCPSARFVGVAMLPDYRLAFTRRSVKRGCGVCDAVPDVSKAVWGAVLEIGDTDVGRLDMEEGYQPGRAKNSYWRKECHVFMNGDDKQPMAVVTFFGDPQDNPPLPNSKYRDLLLSGARRWQLPDAYIEQLESIEVAD